MKLPDTTYIHTHNLACDPSRVTVVGFGERTYKCRRQDPAEEPEQAQDLAARRGSL